jgi:DNA-binding HxlR family transcriptional regulator
MYRYEQHCPVARAAEVVTESWTLLVLRELLRGSERPTDIARGVPRMSASLLATRLRTLAANGLLTEVVGPHQEKRYRLTDAGRALQPVVDQLGRWGQRWLAPPGLRDLDVDVLLRDICAQMVPARLPDRPLTVEVAVSDAPSSGRWWLALAPAGATVRTDAPAEPAGVRLLCTVSGLAGVWLGRHSWLRAVRERTVVLVGPSDAVRSVIAGIGVSRYADPAGGRESA